MDVFWACVMVAMAIIWALGMAERKDRILKTLAYAVSAFAVTLMAAGHSHGAGAGPTVNIDLGCTAAGQVLSYDGTNLVCQAPTRPSVAIGSLPTCNSAATGKMYFVTDALLPTSLAIVAAGGAVKIGVTCNGTNWIVQ